MPKYMVQFSYIGDGLRGLLSEGGSKRREVIEELVHSLGGKLEAYYFSFGEFDGVAITDSADIADHLSGILAINASGTVKTKTTMLITPEEIDEAVKRLPHYRAPGT